MEGLANNAKSLMDNVTAQKELEDIEIVESVPGHVVFEVTAPESVRNYHRTIHGGFLATVCEVAAGMVAYTLEKNNVALTSAVNFIKAVEPGRLIVSGEAEHAGRSTIVVRCRVETPEGALVAEATFTLFVLGRWRVESASFPPSDHLRARPHASCASDLSRTVLITPFAEAVEEWDE